MKKALLVILSFFYIASSTGASINMHYCMGEFAGWNLGHNDEQKCGSCGMDKGTDNSSDCCRDEHKIVKVNDVHKSAQVYLDLLHTTPTLEEHHSLYVPLEFGTLSESYPVINGPPGKSLATTYLLHRSIRI